jgi:hypothetical protein
MALEPWLGALAPENSKTLSVLWAVLGFRMLARPAVLLRIEGGVLFAATILGYWESHASWILFAALLLAPDLSFAGYAAGVKMGAAVYNLVHTLTGPLILLAYGLVAARFSLLPYGRVWALLGYLEPAQIRVWALLGARAIK